MKNSNDQNNITQITMLQQFRFLDRNCDSSSTSHGFLTGAHQFRRYSRPTLPLHFLTIIFLFDIFVMPLLLVIAAQSWPAGINRAQLVPSIDNTNDNNGEQAGRTKKEGGGCVRSCVKYVDRSKFSSHIQRQSLSISPRKIASREIGASVIAMACFASGE